MQAASSLVSQSLPPNCLTSAAAHPIPPRVLKVYKTMRANCQPSIANGNKINQILVGCRCRDSTTGLTACGNSLLNYNHTYLNSNDKYKKTILIKQFLVDGFIERENVQAAGSKSPHQKVKTKRGKIKCTHPQSQESSHFLQIT